MTGRHNFYRVLLRDRFGILSKPIRTHLSALLVRFEHLTSKMASTTTPSHYWRGEAAAIRFVCEVVLGSQAATEVLTVARDEAMRAQVSAGEDAA